MTESSLYPRNFFAVLYTDTSNANKEDFLSDKRKSSCLTNKSQSGLCSLVKFEKKNKKDSKHPW